MSGWWLRELTRFYDSTARELVLRVGRRGGKSTSLCRVAVAEALYGGHYVAPGDTPVIALIAQDRRRSSELLVTLEAILTACDIDYKKTAEAITISTGKRFQVFTASISGVSGPTCICVICDEVSKWKDAETGRNPATEVLASVRPTMATVPRAKMFLSSSPMGSLDAHAKAFERGDTAHQIVAYAPTWVAHPELTEAWTRSLEPNDDFWRREYAALPTEGDSEGLLAPSALDAATREQAIVPRERGLTYIGAMDPGYSQNAWTFGLFTQRLIDGIAKRSMVYAKQWIGSRRQENNPKTVLAEIAQVCADYGAVGVWTDQYEHHALRVIAADMGLVLEVGERSGASRLARYEALHTWSAHRTIDLPPDPVVRADLLSIRRKITPSGFTIDLPESPDGRHADFAPTIALGMAKADCPPTAEATEPEYLSTEWEESKQKKRIALAEKMKANDGILLDEMPRWAGDVLLR